MQAIGPAAENARWPEVLSRKRGTASRWRLEVGRLFLLEDVFLYSKVLQIFFESKVA